MPVGANPLATFLEPGSADAASTPAIISMGTRGLTCTSQYIYLASIFSRPTTNASLLTHIGYAYVNPFGYAGCFPCCGVRSYAFGCAPSAVFSCDTYSQDYGIADGYTYAYTYGYASGDDYGYFYG